MRESWRNWNMQRITPPAQAQRRKLARSAQELVAGRWTRQEPKKPGVDSCEPIVKPTVKNL
jgi:hypothetical protein